jgi:hypothetical protein
MKIRYIAPVCLLVILAMSACTSNKTDSTSTPSSNSSSTISTGSTQIDPAELTDTSKWKKVANESRFFKFSLSVPPSARYSFSPDTVMGTENGVFIGEDRFPYGLTIEYNALNDRDSKTVTFKADYTKGKPSDIDFGLPGAIVAEGVNTRGLPYTRYLVRKDANLYVLSIQTNKPEYKAAYLNMIKTFKIDL